MTWKEAGQPENCWKPSGWSVNEIKARGWNCNYSLPHYRAQRSSSMRKTKRSKPNAVMIGKRLILISSDQRMRPVSHAGERIQQRKTVMSFMGHAAMRKGRKC